MELVKRSGTMALVAIIAAVLAFTCSYILRADRAYATVAKPKVTVVAKSNGQVKVSVSKVKKAKKYQYKITKDKKLKKKAFTKKTSKRSVMVKTLTQGKTYYVVARACDAKGKWGKWSKAKKVTVKRVKPASAVHTHNYQPGGNYYFYEQERAKNYNEAVKYATLMVQYMKTHSWQNGTFNASTYLHYEAMNKLYGEQAVQYKDLRDAEYYCATCGAKKPSTTGDATGLTAAAAQGSV